FRARGAVGDRAGHRLQVLRQARLPDGADSLPFRDEGVVRDQDHGALLDHHCDPLRDRLRTLLPRLHVLPTLSRRTGDTVVRIGAGDSISELAELVAPEGDVLVVDRSVDALEQLRETTTASNVFYLVGSMAVLPLTDASADEILATTVPGVDAAAEFF